MLINTVIIKVPDSVSDTELTSLLKPAADLIKSGGLVAFPTETVYGLGADGTNSLAAEKIFAAKGRPSDNPLIIHIASVDDAEKYAYVNDIYYRLAETFMPGPLTVILPAKETVPRATTGGLDTVAVRCPSNIIANRLIQLSGTAIAAPSANLSGSPSPTSAKHVIDDMMGRVDIIIDGGDCDFGLESTIVKVDDDRGVTLLRPGKITAKDIEAIGIEVRIADAVLKELGSNERALSPGMKYKHYAPRAQFFLIDGDGKRIGDYLSADKSKKIGIIAYTEDIKVLKEYAPWARIFDFGSKCDATEQAHRLFSILRLTDKEYYDVIYAPLPQTRGIELALYNRMIRASAHKIIKL